MADYHRNKPAQIGVGDENPASIELANLFNVDITSSGSFDVRGDISATSFGKLLQALPIPVLLIDQSQDIVAANSAWSRLIPNYKGTEGTSFVRLFADHSEASNAQSMLESVLATRRSQSGKAVLELDGTKIWGRLTFESIRVLDTRFVLVLIENLTPEVQQLQRNEELRRELETKVLQLEKAKKELRASVDEKEFLLRELHHRVKNNLTIVSTMLGLQATHATDEFHRRMFEDSESRLHSLALAHEKLYQTKSLAEVKAIEYLSSLLEHLVGSATSGNRRISLIHEIEDLVLGSDTAMRLGFLLTELVSNCLKHAFPGERAGAILVILRSIGEGEFELVVSDNGVGMAAEIDLEHPESFGLKVVNIFVRTLCGSMEVKRTDGTEFRVRINETE